MKKLLAATALAVATLSVSPMIAAPAAAQSKQGVAVADLETALAQSNAYKVAVEQMGVTYKAQIDQVETRSQTLDAELNVLRARANEESKKTPRNQAALDATVKAFQDKQTAAQRELQTLAQPFELARTYVIDQISLRLDDAVRAAMTKNKVDLLLNYSQQIVLAASPGVDISAAIAAELNTLVPSAQIVPPAGYQAGQLMQQKNQAAIAAARAAQPGAPAAPAPTSQPSTR